MLISYLNGSKSLDLKAWLMKRSRKSSTARRRSISESGVTLAESVSWLTTTMLLSSILKLTYSLTLGMQAQDPVSLRKLWAHQVTVCAVSLLSITEVPLRHHVAQNQSLFVPRIRLLWETLLSRMPARRWITITLAQPIRTITASSSSKISQLSREISKRRHPSLSGAMLTSQEVSSSTLLSAVFDIIH